MADENPNPLARVRSALVALLAVDMPDDVFDILTRALTDLDAGLMEMQRLRTGRDVWTFLHHFVEKNRLTKLFDGPAYLIIWDILTEFERAYRQQQEPPSE